MLSLLRKACDFAAYKFLRAPRGGGKPVPESALDAEYRSGHWDAFFGPQEQPRYDALVALIARMHPRPHLLDVGCGSGHLAALLIPAHVETYTGLDLSAEGLQRARALALPHAHFIHASFESWQTSERFDLIVFNESIGYARDPAAVANTFASFLSPGGALIVSHFRSTNHAAIWRRLYRHFTFADEQIVNSTTGHTWDLKVLRPPPVGQRARTRSDPRPSGPTGNARSAT